MCSTSLLVKSMHVVDATHHTFCHVADSTHVRRDIYLLGYSNDNERGIVLALVLDRSANYHRFIFAE
jgi:hypothetical protein